MLVAGVDEAGRGSVLGPLVIAGVSIEEENSRRLVELGVKDSKLLTPKKRSLLYREIKKAANSVCYEKVQPRSIDEVVLKGERLFRLNFLEARYMARVLAKLEFEEAYVDCCDTNQERFGSLVADLLMEEKVRVANSKRRAGDKESSIALGELNPYKTMIRSEHHADSTYPAVSAASIIAKVTRDAAIRRLYSKHGPFGSGYPSDPLTIEFLKSFISKSLALPSFTRLSWSTIARVLEEQEEL